MCRINNSENKKVLLVFSLFVIISCCLAEEGKTAIRVNNPKNGLPCMQTPTEELRCYCNLPKCVLHGYMCKSRIGCFVQLLVSESSTKTVHGCVEVLPERIASRCCSNEEKNQVTPVKPTLVCCSTHVCNHIDDPNTKLILNHTFGILPDDYESEMKSQQKLTELYSDSEVWFRAATIAVPICGAVIVLLLVVLACRILKNGNDISTHQKLRPQMYVIPSKHKRDQPTKLPIDNYQCYMNRKSYYSPLSPIVIQQQSHISSNNHNQLLVAQDFVDTHSWEFIHNEKSSNLINDHHCNKNEIASVIFETDKNSTARESLNDSKINLVEHQQDENMKIMNN